MNLDSFNYSINPTNITAGFLNEFTIYIANYSSSDIVFPNAPGLIASEMPDMDKLGDPDTDTDKLGDPDTDMFKNTACFYMFFSYGDNETDMTDIEYVKDIRVEQPSDWTIGVSTLPDIGVYWKICPKTSVLLKAKTKIPILVSNVRCNDFDGPTPVYLALQVDGKKSATKTIGSLIKHPKPMINRFEIDNYDKKELTIGQNVKFIWDLKNVDSNTVFIDEQPVFNKGSAMIILEDKRYTFTAPTSTGCVVEASYTPEIEYVDLSFTYDKKKSGHVTIKCAFTKNTKSCSIVGYGELRQSGQFPDYDLLKHNMIAKMKILDILGKTHLKEIDFNIKFAYFDIIKYSNKIRLLWDVQNAESCGIAPYGQFPTQNPFCVLEDENICATLGARNKYFEWQYEHMGKAPYDVYKEFVYKKLIIEFCEFSDSNKMRVKWRVKNAEYCELCVGKNGHLYKERFAPDFETDIPSLFMNYEECYVIIKHANYQFSEYKVLMVTDKPIIKVNGGCLPFMPRPEEKIVVNWKVENAVECYFESEKSEFEGSRIYHRIDLCSNGRRFIEVKAITKYGCEFLDTAELYTDSCP